MRSDFDENWYDNLAKPKFQPPKWIFAPVWTVLYIMMFFAFGLVLAHPFRWINLFAYFIFVAQLVVNFSWSPAFFKEHNLRKAFLLSVVLTVLVFLTLVSFYYISKFASLLILPYFFWCLFATVLSFEILELNEW